VVLVIDASTSMRDEFSSAGRRKLDAAREAATLFIQQLDLTGGDQGAIVQFNDDAKLLVPLTRNRALLAEGLASIQVNRQTRMQLGIRLARAELSGRHHRALNTRTLILLTDGANNPEPVAEAEREAELARGDGVRVFTVALGTEVEREALIRMASSTADYFHAPDGEDLIRIYSRIAYAIPCRAEQFWGLR
jgi:Ca-activated chloride channel family protein